MSQTDRYALIITSVFGGATFGAWQDDLSAGFWWFFAQLWLIYVVDWAVTRWPTPTEEK